MKGWTEKPEIFYEDKSGSSVYLSICLSVHLSVITSYLTDISVSVAQIKKIQKRGAFFSSNFASGRTLPTQSTGPHPIQLVHKHRFYRYFSFRL